MFLIQILFSCALEHIMNSCDARLLYIKTQFVYKIYAQSLLLCQKLRDTLSFECPQNCVFELFIRCYSIYSRRN